MNCKQGDLAILVRSAAGNEGAIVQVIAPCPGNGLPVGSIFEIPGHARRVCKTDSAFWWVVQGPRPMLCSDGVLRDSTVVPDSNLRPIRDNDGEDETLSWAGKPVETINPARV